MLIEKPLSICAVLVSAGLLIPEAAALAHQPLHVPSASMLFGAVAGAVGIYLGAAVAFACESRPSRVLRLFTWLLLAVALTGCLALGAFRATGGQHTLLAMACALPLSSLALALFHSRSSG